MKNGDLPTSKLNLLSKYNTAVWTNSGYLRADFCKYRIRVDGCKISVFLHTLPNQPLKVEQY